MALPAKAGELAMPLAASGTGRGGRAAFGEEGGRLHVYCY